MAAATNEYIRVAWRNEIQKEQISLKKEADKAMRKAEVTVSFDEGSVIIGEESCTEWKEGWKKLKKILTEGQKRNNNKVWQRRGFKVKYPTIIVKKTLGG